ncbi:carboxymuconolactone decarboxylase family protein [Actinomarinicola tropica]|uniref:Carboxymuconolactone decarboxylase family protein n=1 Tax=Actinomarinicola tropica TaxID=2789776 RepID=A0A5Q2RSS2_9ACTN|nr:carboxymuconolactone decarboxylase family protein [Actinomarinicola tropica]QGG96960.1 carboxymuconolactone decarboxylase family protein [Actinomarinicola tropica]
MTLHEIAPAGVRAVHALETEVRAHIDHRLMELVKVRASIINGCAYCVDMHGTDLLDGGEDVRRVLAVTTWRESPFFTPAERAALALTDAVTRLGEHGVDDDVWAAAVDAHGEEGTAWLLLAIATINVWNRVAVPTHAQPPGLAAA